MRGHPGSLVRFEFVLTNAALPIHLQWNREDPYWRTNVIFAVTNYETGEGYWQNFYVGTNTPIPGATNAEGAWTQVASAAIT